MMNGDALDAVDENTRPEIIDSNKRGRESPDRPESKRMRASSPAPSIGAIDVSGTGEIGWDEQFFTR